MYNEMAIKDHTVLYSWNLLREQNLTIVTKKKKINMWSDKFVKLTQ